MSVKKLTLDWFKMPIVDKMTEGQKYIFRKYRIKGYGFMVYYLQKIASAKNAYLKATDENKIEICYETGVDVEYYEQITVDMIKKKIIEVREVGKHAVITNHSIKEVSKKTIAERAMKSAKMNENRTPPISAEQN